MTRAGETSGTLLSVGTLASSVIIRRDEYGIPHIEAGCEADAWFGMGYASAADRLWQMDWYRLRGTGRWASIAGQAAVRDDIFFRRLRLEDACRADVDAMSDETRAMFDAYAAGVNAFIATGQRPPEYALAGIEPAPWEPWHSVLVFKVRHALMGKWQTKLAYTRLLSELGPERFHRFIRHSSQPGAGLVLPPGGVVEEVAAAGLEELEAVAAGLGDLAVDDGGSNSWAVHGSRSTTGQPVICNDSHRPLDVPNVYWQAHVSWPGVNVLGGAFPGFPAFPHFGYNGQVAWNITHGMADSQDLFVEQFREEDGRIEYRTPVGWAEASVRAETVEVRGGEAVGIETSRTVHGPIVHGDPRTGVAMALCWIAIDRPDRQWECLRPMIDADSVEDLFATQEDWVDPVNNLVAADRAGNIGYLTRGRLPVRTSRQGRMFPVPGWTGDHEWVEDVPFAAMPRAVNPSEGFIGTANQRIVESDEPYIANEFAVAARAERIAEVLGEGTLSPEKIAELQGDTVSLPARAWVRFLGESGPFEGDAERARAMLAGWDADLRADSGSALLYACFRRVVAEAVFAPAVGENLWRWLVSEANPATYGITSAMMANLAASLHESDGTPDGRLWSDVLPEVLQDAWSYAVSVAGPEPDAWRWVDYHHTAAKHPLSTALPDRAATLDPPQAAVGGDADTIRVSTYRLARTAEFPVTVLSVYRQVVDFADPEHPSWIIPGGASGVPAGEHYADQLDDWAAARRIPAYFSRDDVARNAPIEIELIPGEVHH